MPIDLQRNGTRDGLGSIRYPGLYQHVLQKVCRRQAFDPCEYLSLDLENEAAEAAWHAECEAKVAALVEKRNGEPVIAHSHDLPNDLPSTVLARFPAGGRQRTFRVTKDDKIVMRPIPS